MGKEEYYLPSRPDKRGKWVLGWLMHRHGYNKQSRRVTLLEQYTYFPKKILPVLLKFLQTKQFQYTQDAKIFARYFNILIAKEGKVHTGQLEEPNSMKHEYKTHFARVLTHRHQTYLIRVYECLTNNQEQVKLEILHVELYRNSESKRRIYGLRNPMEKLFSMNEIRKKVDKRFKPDKTKKYPDHSGGKPMQKFVESMLKQAKKNTPDVHKRMMKYQHRFSELF